MNTNKLVTAEGFYNAFIECWKKEALDTDKETLKSGIIEKYAQSGEWTKCMLGDKAADNPEANEWAGMKASFLYKVKSKLCCGLRDRPNADGKLLRMSREWYTLDAVFYSGNNLFGSLEKGKEYPPLLDVLIEHENGGDVETEMWKLLLFRAPLKVIIFYDWGCNDKIHTTEKKRKERTQWLPDKLGELALMAMKVEHLWPENEDTEYLFIVGHRDSEDQLRWIKFSLSELIEKYCCGSITDVILDKRKNAEPQRSSE